MFRSRHFSLPCVWRVQLHRTANEIMDLPLDAVPNRSKHIVVQVLGIGGATPR